MIGTHANQDFTTVYRPRRISEVYGNDENKRIIASGLDEGTLPHSLLFQGVSGTGKTSMARIVGMGLNCKTGLTSEPCCECESCRCHLHNMSFAYKELNAAHLTSIDDLRRERQEFDAYPLGDFRSKVYVFDECHRLSKNAQDLLLREVEEPVAITYFILCTTEPKGIVEPLRNRCMALEFNHVPDEEIMRLLQDVSKREQLVCRSEVLEQILDQAHGKPRNALLLLQKAVLAGKVDRDRWPDTIEGKMGKLRSMTICKHAERNDR
jgi:DNA polymerase III subunit gamma/tau